MFSLGLRLMPAANPLPINPKPLGRPIRMQQASGITRGSCGSRLIEGGSGRNIRPGSEPFLQLCESFTKRTDRKTVPENNERPHPTRPYPAATPLD